MNCSDELLKLLTVLSVILLLAEIECKFLRNGPILPIAFVEIARNLLVFSAIKLVLCNYSRTFIPNRRLLANKLAYFAQKLNLNKNKNSVQFRNKMQQTKQKRVQIAHNTIKHR